MFTTCIGVRKGNRMSDTMKLTISRGTPPAATTAEGLPDTSTQQATRHNAKLLWQGAVARTSGVGTPFSRNQRPGKLVGLNVSKLMTDMWDGYDASPLHAPSTAARVGLYKYLRDATVMVCTERRAGDGSTWWIANDWQDKPATTGGNYSERRVTRTQAGEDRDPEPVEVRYTCQFPGCPDDRQMLPQNIGRHLGAHGVTFADYKLMLAGTKPWPGDMPEPETRVHTEATRPADSTDPVDAVEALVAEVRQLRALVSDSDLIEENKYLRAQLDETLARNEKLRQRLAAADKAIGRR
jgi:hypothetical protein